MESSRWGGCRQGEAFSTNFFSYMWQGFESQFCYGWLQSDSGLVHDVGAIRHSNSVGLSCGHGMSHNGLGDAIGMMQLPSPSNSDAVLATV